MIITTKKLLFIYIILATLIGIWLFLRVAEAQALCVKTSRANLRQGPGIDYEKLWVVFKYMPLRKLSKKGNWFRVKDVDGDIYWIYKKLVDSSFKCAVVKTKKANFRLGPGTRNSQVAWSPMGKYFSMKVLKVKGKWVKIMDSAGGVAWVHRSLVWIQ